MESLEQLKQIEQKFAVKRDRYIIYNQNENNIEEIKTNNLVGFKTLNCN
jgi:hypothetical protein